MVTCKLTMVHNNKLSISPEYIYINLQAKVPLSILYGFIFPHLLRLVLNSFLHIMESYSSFSNLSSLSVSFILST